MILIDTAPSLGVVLAAALIAADFVLSPIELETYSVQGIQKRGTAIANVRQANPKLQFLGMAPSKVDARKAAKEIRALANCVFNKMEIA